MASQPAVVLKGVLPFLADRPSERGSANAVSMCISELGWRPES